MGNRYQILSTGPLVGFILLGLAVLFTGFTVFYRTMMARKEKRIRQHFRQRLRQSVALKSFSVNNSKQFEGMFKRIDAEGTGYIEKKELRDYMNKREPVFRQKILRISGLPLIRTSRVGLIILNFVSSWQNASPIWTTFRKMNSIIESIDDSPPPFLGGLKLHIILRYGFR